MTRSVHLFGNWKWTGPADPVLGLVQSLGPEASLLLGPCPYPDLEHAMAMRATDRGISHRTIPSLQKHLNPFRIPRAAADLAQALSEDPADVVHVHFDADHAAAARAWSLTRPCPVLVRSIHDGASPSRRRLRLLRQHTDLLVAPTQGVAERLEQDLGWDPGDVAVLETGVDPGRFQCTDQSSIPLLRSLIALLVDF